MQWEKRRAVLEPGEGRELLGLAMPYGSEALLPGGLRERFEPGAFGSDIANKDVLLNVQHDRGRPLARTGGGGMQLTDTAEGLRMRAMLPDTPAADETLALVRAGVLRGLSVEFQSVAERFDGNVRIIERARLGAIAVVDSGAYPAADVEARARRKKEPRTWIRGGVRYGVESYCGCLDGDCSKVYFRPRAMSGFDDGGDVLALIGRTSEAVGSTRGGTLTLRDTPEALEFEIAPAGRDTAAGRQLMDLAQARVPVFARPLIDEAESEFTDAGGVRTFTSARVKSLLIKPIAGGPELRQGWEPLDIPVDEPARRARRIWL